MIISILFILLTPSQPTFAEEYFNDFKAIEVKTQIAQYEYKAIIYEPLKEKIKAILIISHSLSDKNSIEEANAKYFSKHGFAVITPLLFLTEIDKLLPDTERLDSDFLRPIKSVKNFIEIAELKLDLKKDLPIFALGASQGGITTLILTANNSRIKAAWQAVAGGDLPYIYSHSDVDKLIKFRKNHMLTLGITSVYEYENYLRANLKNDPLVECKGIKVPFHQVIALKDSSVPTVTQEMLVKECPKHYVERFYLSHIGGSMSTITMREKFREFFESFI